MSKKTKISLLLCCGICAFFGLILRLFFLQILHYDILSTRANNQFTNVQTISANRGNIYDRNGTPLALTKPVFSVYAVPYKIKNKQKTATALAQHLHIHKKSLLKKIQGKQHFVWIKRKVSGEIYQALIQKKLPGIGFIEEAKRIYPHRSLAAHILGFVGIDNQGLGGIEYAYDTALRGKEGKIVLEEDPRGQQIVSGKYHVINSPKHGDNIHLTIDEFIQYSTEKHLKDGIINAEALSGQAIVMDPQSGDILALANYPTFDPNHHKNYLQKQKKNTGITDVYEPGSVFKLITVSAVLEEGLVEPTTLIDVPEQLFFHGRWVKEAHKREPEDPDNYSVKEIIQRSLNVGSTLLAIKLGNERLYKYMKSFGFGTPYRIGLPGESAGLLRSPKEWSKVDIAMISFGQGIAVTPLQMITAIAAIANGGTLVVPRIVHHLSSQEGLYLKAVPKKNKGRVLSEKVSSQVRDMMVAVVEKGTGITARIPGYAIAGKTGTAQKAGPNGIGYSEDAYVASFIGTFPAEHPKFIIMVVIDTPKKSIWGSTVAGPVFKNIALDLIDYATIYPRDAQTQKQNK